ncbi:MAG: S8 family serine peptidase [Bacteroidota bacterium]
MKILQHLLLCVIFSSWLVDVEGQEKDCWIIFKDKPEVDYNITSMLSPASIERREKHGLPIIDYHDLPVSALYKEEIEKKGYPVLAESRWLNGVFVRIKKNQVVEFKNLPYVSEVISVGRSVSVCKHEELSFTPGSDDHELARMQLNAMEGELFKNIDVDGRGIRIAVFDIGFKGVDKSPAFKHLFDNNQIAGTWDFVKDREFVYDYGSHGTKVLSCITGNLNGIRTGLASGAEFLLARTEVRAEKFIEEKNWFLAMEWADRNGADIINSSLGYTYHRYFNWQMDGQSVLVSRVANIAASKGILVVNAMGNDGNSPWKFVGAPADADSVLSVGGINPETGVHIAFSSYGPTADLRRKPNVSAFGMALTSDTKSGLSTSYGTSFAAPLVTGFAACAMQLYPEDSNMEIFNRIEQSGSLYPYFDYVHGYGIPKASRIIENQIDMSAPTFSFENSGDSVKIIIDHSFYNGDYLYYHLENNEKSILNKYGVVEVNSRVPLVMNKSEIRKNHVLNVFYRGYMGTFPMVMEIVER